MKHFRVSLATAPIPQPSPPLVSEAEASQLSSLVSELSVPVLSLLDSGDLSIDTLGSVLRERTQGQTGVSVGSLVGSLREKKQQQLDENRLVEEAGSENLSSLRRACLQGVFRELVGEDADSEREGEKTDMDTDDPDPERSAECESESDGSEFFLESFGGDSLVFLREVLLPVASSLFPPSSSDDSDDSDPTSPPPHFPKDREFLDRVLSKIVFLRSINISRSPEEPQTEGAGQQLSLYTEAVSRIFVGYLCAVEREGWRATASRSPDSDSVDSVPVAYQMELVRRAKLLGLWGEKEREVLEGVIGWYGVGKKGILCRNLRELIRKESE